MYHTIKAGTYHPALKANASIIGLRVGSNCDQSLFRLAFNVLGKIDRFLKNNGTLTDSVQALFSRVYSDNTKLSNAPKKRIQVLLMYITNNHRSFFTTG